MKNLYENICQAKSQNQKLLAILIDPDKFDLGNTAFISQKINASPATHIFVGGSIVKENNIDELITALKKVTPLPIILFPGHPSQISAEADGILFLMLISGRNPDYLIGYQIQAVPALEKTSLEIISTGYILIESGSETAVERVSLTTPLSRNNPDRVAQTAKAGEYAGNKLIYLEGGSGAKLAVPKDMILQVSSMIKIPLIVGGGIRSLQEIQKAYDAGADMVVIGTAFENNSDFFNPQP